MDEELHYVYDSLPSFLDFWDLGYVYLFVLFFFFHALEHVLFSSFFIAHSLW
jgi:hypothetical protein